MPPPAIGIDVGASKISSAVVGPDGDLRHCGLPSVTPSHPAELLAVLAATVERLRAAVPEVASVGVGVAGVVDHVTGHVGFVANHNNGNLDLRRALSETCGLPVVVGNDADAAVWSETSHADRVLLLAVGTGLGSGYIRQGELMRDVEFGHLVVERGGRTCRCGNSGCLEAYVSGRALEAAGHGIVEADPGGDLARRAADAGGLSTAVVIDAALGGDPAVVSVVTDMGVRLGIAVANIMGPFRVERVVVGGGLSTLGELLLEPMRRTCEEALAPCGFLRAPEIALAEYGKLATVVGAALLARQSLNATHELLAI